MFQLVRISAITVYYCVWALKRIASISLLRGSLLRGSLLRGSLSPTFPTFAKKHMFYKIGHNSGPKGAPDMILTALDVKFHEKKYEIPPRACRPSKSEEQKLCAGYGLEKVKNQPCG